MTKAYLADTGHKKFSEAFADNTRRLGVSEDMQRCLEIQGTAALINTLPFAFASRLPNGSWTRTSRGTGVVQS